MPAYTSPTAANVRDWCGINRFILDQDATADTAVDALLGALLTQAEAIVATQVTEAIFDLATHTARQVKLLQRAVALRTGMAFLAAPEAQKITGTQEPLESGDGPTIEDVRKAWALEADGLVNLFLESLEGGGSVKQFKHPYGATTEAQRKFTRGMDW
jgi:hypothetical protein